MRRVVSRAVPFFLLPSSSFDTVAFLVSLRFAFSFIFPRLGLGLFEFAFVSHSHLRKRRACSANLCAPYEVNAWDVEDDFTHLEPLFT